ncbi:MAG: HupE/UreJ family protein [Bacteroidia bacterium]|nr:HupE/UreJ family protein [Bacteroidia bacterium]HQV01004.1 HupE/UreJ family protein [Bacteroidia bacterium]
MFRIFFTEGFYHIVSWEAIDHILYLLVLVVSFDISKWRSILLLVTTFTVAHTLALFVSVAGLFYLHSNLVEVLIAITIAATCIENLISKKILWVSVLTALCFGFIHGLGFSATLTTMFNHIDINYFETLLPFNLGVECGQIVVLIPILSVLFYLSKYTGMSTKQKSKLISWCVLIVSCVFIMQRV